MVGGVEEMGKKPFLVFREPEGFGKGSQRHLEETEGVLEDNVPTVDDKDMILAPLTICSGKTYCLYSSSRMRFESNPWELCTSTVSW